MRSSAGRMSSSCLVLRRQSWFGVQPSQSQMHGGKGGSSQCCGNQCRRHFLEALALRLSTQSKRRRLKLQPRSANRLDVSASARSRPHGSHAHTRARAHNAAVVSSTTEGRKGKTKGVLKRFGRTNREKKRE